MTLIDDFFTIVSSREAGGTIEYKVAFNPQHKVYQVHFPGNPITPGVCLVQMVTELLALRYGSTFLLRKAVNIRFKRPVYPTDTPIFTLKNTEPHDGQLHTAVSIEDNGGQYAKMSLLFSVV